MAIIATGTGGGGGFQPAPAGLHQGVCVDVIDMGVLEVTYQGKTKKQHKIRVAWQIDEAMDDGKPFLVQKRYTLSLNDKATLRKDLESWRGKVFSEAELQGFDVEVLIDVNCQLNIQRVTKGDQVYANVVSIVPLGKNMRKIQSRAYVRVKDRTETSAQPEDNGSPLTDDDIPF